jgi:hypothetical protein
LGEPSSLGASVRSHCDRRADNEQNAVKTGDGGDNWQPAVFDTDRLPSASSTKKAAQVEIIEEPALELAHDDLAIITWTTSNPGGSDDHFGAVYYGRYPEDLRQRAESHIRLNRAHPETIFRVRISGLQPRTTYYYRVTSIESDGGSDGVASPVERFTMPGQGERLLAYPARPAPEREEIGARLSLLTIRIRPAFSRAI